MVLTNDGLEVFKALLNDDCIRADGNTTSHGILVENDSKANLKKVTISDLKQGMLLLTMDEGRKQSKTKTKIECMSPLFRIGGQYAHNCVCDAVLLRKMPSGSYEICYIELKSDKPTKFKDQFKSTQCFVEYVCNIAKAFCDQNIDISRNRYVVLHTESTSQGKKTRTRFGKEAANTPDNPEMIIVKNGDKVRFSQLL